jgi:23S rRNA (uracil1939-C5)-methyltransferase
MRYIQPVRKGMKLRVQITSLDEEGQGLAATEEARLHVRGALPTEQVAAEIAHVSQRRREAWAEVLEIEKPAKERTAPRCAAYGRCGACVLQHLDYAAQLQWKSERLRMLTMAHSNLAGVPVEDCVASPSPFGYRNKSKLVYSRRMSGQRRPVLGAFAPRSHRVVDLRGCALVEPPLAEVADGLASLLGELDIPDYDERTGEGTLRYVILRSNFRAQVLCTLVAARPFAEASVLAKALSERHPKVAGVVLNLNVSRGNVLYGATEELLFGKAFLDEEVGPSRLRLRLSSKAFFQVNRAVAARIYSDLLAATRPLVGERVVDCYCGVGGIALTFSTSGAEVVGVEENEAAVHDARAGAATLSSSRPIRFVTGDVVANLGVLGHSDIVALNPPRRGCAEELLRAVSQASPRAIVYLSCDPISLIRDLDQLLESGYRVEWLRPYDMLPHTPHIETLALLSRM